MVKRLSNTATDPICSLSFALKDFQLEIGYNMSQNL